MKEHSKILIQLLSSAVNGTNLPALRDLPDWTFVYEEAKAHQVHTLLFPLLEKLPPEHRPSPPLMETWKCETLREAALQLLHIEQMEKVFSSFSEAGIAGIALKGLVLRDYYPHPELRTMGDSDILIHREDTAKAHAALSALGYLRGQSCERHTTYSLEGALDIELHEILTETEELEEKTHFSTSVWAGALPVHIGKASALKLSVNHQIIHLLFHEIHHILLSGLGLRQLCDLTLYISAHSAEISWEEIMGEMREYGWEKFTVILLLVCRQLLGLSLSEPFSEGETIESAAYRQLLIEDIINSGVYGKRTGEREASRHILSYMKNTSGEAVPSHRTDKAAQGGISSVPKLFRFFFPSRNKLGYQYRYARKYPLLLPLAWLHRAFYNVKRLYLLPFVYNRETAAAYEERIRLLQWLQLR